ncbi:MAG: DUF177 domain-containing protein [Deltaproteobacteria bacterium]|nr:DUF177 domain-containing protein [Deltaproteobacteria bacterium]
MKLTVSSIPLEGQTIELTPRLSWLCEIVAEALSGLNGSAESLAGSLSLNRVDRIVSLRGEMGVDINPACDRCLTAFVQRLHVPLHIDLSPRTEIGDSAGSPWSDEEMETSAADLDFSFYQEPEIDLKEIIREQVVLALPLQFLCAENCRGLCPRCGANLNVELCRCLPDNPADPRWGPLKKWKQA